MYLFENDEHRELRKNVRRFAETHVRPYATAWEEAEEFPKELYREAAGGDPRDRLPEAYGGGGGDLSHVLVAAKRRWCSRGHSVGHHRGLGSHGIALPPILRSGPRRRSAKNS
jgi:acyl-CoA dehydrogenase